MHNIIITGASGNLGTALVQALADKPFRLHLVLRKASTEPIDPKIVHHVAELSSDAECQALVTHIEQGYGPVFSGVFLAGAYHHGKLEDTSWADVQRMFDTNVGTVVPLYMALAKHFQQTGQGKLITIGAQASQGKAAQNHIAYALSKDVLRHLTTITHAGFGNATTAHIIMPKTLDTPASRAAMPNEPADSFTKIEDIVTIIMAILQGANKESVINC